MGRGARGEAVLMLCGWLGASAPHPLPRTLSEMPQTQMRAGSCLKVVRTDGLRGSTDPQTHGDERPSASGCCARVLDGAGGLVGVRHEEHFEHLIVHVSLALTTTEQERTHARSIAPNAQELPPGPQ